MDEPQDLEPAPRRPKFNFKNRMFVTALQGIKKNKVCSNEDKNAEISKDKPLSSTDVTKNAVAACTDNSNSSEVNETKEGVVTHENKSKKPVLCDITACTKSEIARTSLQKSEKLTNSGSHIKNPPAGVTSTTSGKCLPNNLSEVTRNGQLQPSVISHKTSSLDNGYVGSDRSNSAWSLSNSSHNTYIQSVTSAVHQVVEEQKGLEQDTVAKIHDTFINIVRKHFDGCFIRLYGSYYSGSAIVNSDINLEFYSNLGSNISNKFLNVLYKTFEESLPDFFVQSIESQSGKPDYIMCTEPEFGTKCVIRILGSESSHYRTSKLLKDINRLDARIQQLVIAFRHWAEVCAIHEPESGRLHPLAFVFMVIHYLQRVIPPIVPIIDVQAHAGVKGLPNKNHQLLGELWLGLLRYYSSEFNWRDHVVSITSSEIKLKSQYKWGKCWIGIESPYDCMNNIGKTVSSQDVSLYIQNCLKKTYTYFLNPIEDVQTTSSIDSIESGSCVSSTTCEYYFMFNSHNFTKGLDKPSMCIECIELGYTCDECIENEFEDQDVESVPEYEVPRYFIDIISETLKEVADINLLSEEEVESRKNLVAEFQRYVRRRFYDAKLELMGSSVNGFGFKNSDLDICMTTAGKSADDVDQKKIIRELCFHLRRNRDFGCVFAVYSAKIPLVQFHHLKTDLRGDISLYNLLAVHNSRLLHSYSIIDNRVRILGCAMKLLAKNACIADTAQKSLSSYSYILMVIHFLQRTNPPILPMLQELYDGPKSPHCIVEECNAWFFRFNNVKDLLTVWKRNINDTSVGELWLQLLQYYTEVYDPTQVISIRQSRPMNSSSIQRHARLFNIEDPFILHKNLGSVMSEEMSGRTWKTLLRAKKLFTRSTEEVPSGFKSFNEYLFHPMCLTDGIVLKTVECEICGKLGHSREKCARFILNRGRGRGRGLHAVSGASRFTNSKD